MDMVKRKFIVFGTDVSGYHLSYIWEGIARHFAHGDHSVEFFPLGITHLESLLPREKWEAGVIGVYDSEVSRDYLRERGIPFLDLCGRNNIPETGFTVGFRGEGRRAAQFFIEDLGLRNLAFFGSTLSPSHDRRLDEFREVAASHGIEVQGLVHERVPMARFFELDAQYMGLGMHAVSALMQTIPKPAGIFCANDELALILRFQAELVGIAVPRELSIVGVGSLHRASGGAHEFVSVVQLDHQKMGEVSARLMESFLVSGQVPESVYLRPDNIIHRYTTLRRSVKDSLVRQARDLIQKEPGIPIAELCRELGVARRTLEVHFRAAEGSSVGKVIDQERFQRAQHLLKNFGYSIETVASLAGYASSRNMLRSFHRWIRQGPTEYRRGLREGRT